MRRTRNTAVVTALVAAATVGVLIVEYLGVDDDDTPSDHAAQRTLLSLNQQYELDTRQVACDVWEKCGSPGGCETKCEAKLECAGYSVEVPIVEIDLGGSTCRNISVTGSEVSFRAVFRKPGPPCLEGDQVVTNLGQETETRHTIVKVASDSTEVTTDDNTTITKPLNRLYRLNTIKERYENCVVDTSDSHMYPPDTFSKSQRRSGAIILYAMGVLYMFFALAIVCDDYFVPALETLAIKLNLSDDVAGATFMAAGGSAPELFTSFIGVFIAKSDVGFGTIIGSAVFNVLFVIGACSIATMHLAKESSGLPLTWWPLSRDSLFYLTDLVLLMVFFVDKEIQIYESAILILLYGVYVVFMGYNTKIYTKIRTEMVRIKGQVPTDRVSSVESGTGIPQAKAKARMDSMKFLSRRTSRKTSVAPDIEKAVDICNANDVASSVEGSEAEDDPWSPVPPPDGVLKWILLFPLNFPLWLILPSAECLEAEKQRFHRERKLTILKDRLTSHGSLAKTPEGVYIFPTITWFEHHSSQLLQDEDELREGEADLRPPGAILSGLLGSFEASSRFTGHQEAAAFLEWSPGPSVASVQYASGLKRKFGPFFGRKYVGGFCGSICWIGTFTYLMVWWAETIGKDLGISDVVMGITFLAAGTSVPDLISSVLVATDGKADMAVSSSIGSNIFDVTFGLPVPWFLWSLFHGGDPVTVEANALGTSVLMLVGMLICVLAAIAFLGWRLNVLLGGLCLILYCIFVTLTILMSDDVIATAF